MVKIILLFVGLLSLIISYNIKNFQLFLFSFCIFFSFLFFLRNINKKLVLIFFSTIITLTVIESFIFLTNNKQIFKKKESIIQTNIKYVDSFLGYQPKPGVQEHKLIINGKTHLNAKYTINNDGFRLTPGNNVKKRYRINFFGGSFTFGWGLNDDETLPYIFFKIAKNWNSFNYGIPGYGVHQSLALLTKKEIEGNLNLLLTSIGHAPRSSCLRDYSFGTPKYILNNGVLIRDGFCNQSIIKFVKLPRIIGSIINRSEIINIIKKIIKKKNENSEDSINLYISIIKKINEISAKNGQQLIVGYTKSDSKFDQFVITSLLNDEIKVVDLSLDDNKENFLGSHPSKIANKKRAELLRQYLVEKKLFH